jgi:hypothetical protein
MAAPGLFRSTLDALAQARDPDELRNTLMDRLGDLFDARAWGFYLLNGEGSRPLIIDVRGMPDRFIEAYETVGRHVDPVMREVVHRHAPAHSLSTLPPDRWRQTTLYREVSSRYGLEHRTRRLPDSSGSARTA